MPDVARPAPTPPSGTGSSSGSGEQWEARRVRASGSSIALAILALLAIVFFRELFLAATQPIGWVAAAAALALVIAPLVEIPARVLPRGLAVLTTMILGVAVIGTLGAGLFVEIREQLNELGDVLPSAAAELEERHDVLADLQLGSLVGDLVDQTSDRISPDASVEGAAGTVPAFFVSGVLVVFIVLWAGRLFEALQRQITDDRRRDRVARVTILAVRLAQRHITAAVGLALAAGAVGGSAAWVAGLPTPLVLGVVTGVASLVPYIGILFAALPVLILASVTEPALTTVLLGLAFIALQGLHTVAMRRVVEARSLRIGPAVVVVAALIGSDVYGIGGALVAIVAGIVAIALVEALGEVGDAPPDADARS